MKHLGTRTIETPRLRLRRFVLEDAPSMYRNWASDPEVTKYLTWPAHEDTAVTEMVIGSWIADYEKPDFYQWAIELKSLGEPIGSISVVKTDELTHMAHIGYVIGSSWWRQGIMTEALNAVMDFLFRQVGCQRIEAAHDTANPNSGAVMRKCGMRYEGTLRMAGHNQQGFCDVCWYGKLSSDA